MLAFVFGGGSARGALQVGALDVLTRHGIRPDMVVGTSVGAVNAAYFAYDPTPEGVEFLKSMYMQVDKEVVFKGSQPQAVLRLLNGDRSFFDSDNWYALLKEYAPAERFRYLALPCYIIATNVNTGAARVFGDNPDDSVLEAVMASSAMVPMHPPWCVDGQEYVDGGFRSNLPVLQANDRGAERVIAFNLTNQFRGSEQRMKAMDMLHHAVDLLMNSQVEAMLEHARYRAELKLLLLNLTYERYVESSDFSQMGEMISRGQQIVEAMLDDGLLTDFLEGS